jgi:hypothetical protein
VELHFALGACRVEQLVRHPALGEETPATAAITTGFLNAIVIQSQVGTHSLHLLDIIPDADGRL